MSNFAYKVLADPRRLQQILINLVSNAIKFTDKGSIRISAELAQQNVAVSVCDTGIGIDAIYHKRVFESFDQGDGNTARNYGGTGLGLSITKKLVELQGGEIQLISSSGHGSSFRFGQCFAPPMLQRLLSIGVSIACPT